MSDEVKVCPRCGEAKALTDDNWYFYETIRHDQLVWVPAGYCRPCNKEYQRENARKRYKEKKARIAQLKARNEAATKLRALIEDGTAERLPALTKHLESQLGVERTGPPHPVD